MVPRNFPPHVGGDPPYLPSRREQLRTHASLPEGTASRCRYQRVVGEALLWTARCGVEEAADAARCKRRWHHGGGGVRHVCGTEGGVHEGRTRFVGSERETTEGVDAEHAGEDAH